jgi:glycosyltransferase involved in cell wall biosynthesis
VLAHLPPDVERIVAVPRAGNLSSVLAHRGLIDVPILLPSAKRRWLGRLTRLVSTSLVALAAWRRRRSIAAIHANGPEELNVAGPAALISRRPVVLWSHARDESPWTAWAARGWRRILPELRIAVVSDAARSVIVGAGLAGEAEIEIVPNPVDPDDVLAERREGNGVTSVGYLGADARYKGFQFLPEIDRDLEEVSLRWLIFSDPRSADAAPVWEQLRRAGSGRVALLGKQRDVRTAYARCDVVLCPSLEETFCRVAAEAMLNGIPVVGADLPPLRRLLGEDEAGLLFPPGDVHAAASAVLRLVRDPALRRRLGERGRMRAREFVPEEIIGRLAAMYGLIAEPMGETS